MERFGIMDKIVIGVASTRRDVFDVGEAIRYKDIVLDEIRKYNGVNIVDIDDINEEGLLFDESDLDSIEKKFRAANIDGIILLHCNFGTEFLVGKLAKRLGKPVLLWGPRDDEPKEDGTRSRDTQCGLFASGKVLRRLNVPFSYIPNCRITDVEFVNGFTNFLAVCSIIKAFRKTKILQISTRPAAFWTMMINEGELLEKFGIQIVPISLTEMLLGMEDIISENGEEYVKTVTKLNSMDCSELEGTDGVAKIAAIKVFIRKTALEYGCSAVCLQCWSALQDAIDIMPCAANGMLADEFLPTMCETDIHGCISSIMLQAALRYTTPVFFADLTIRHPSNDNAELLWHCGNFPSSCARNSNDVCISRNFVLESKSPGICNFELKHDNITICRFDGDNGEYSLFIGEGKATDGPVTSGTYVWFEVPDWKKWEYMLVMGPYVHHVAGAFGNASLALYESCKYIPGLKADPADPTRDELNRKISHFN